MMQKITFCSLGIIVVVVHVDECHVERVVSFTRTQIHVAQRGGA